MTKLRELKGFEGCVTKLDDYYTSQAQHGFQLAINRISDVNVVVDEDALVSEISNHFYCNHHSAQSCNCHSKWKECVRIISYKLNRIIRLEKQTIFGMNVKTDDKLKNNEFRLEKSDDK